MTKINTSLASALDFLASTYATAEVPQAEVIETVLPAAKAPKAAKAAKAAKAKREKDAPIAPKLEALPANMPAIGSLDAEGFMLAIRDAGCVFVERVNEVTGNVVTVKVRDESKVRADMIRAIHAFVGYDPSGNFGAQESAARTKAKNTLRPDPIPAATAHRRGGASVAPTVAGYVAGMPDHAARYRANLLAQQRLSENTLVDLLKLDAESAIEVAGVPMTVAVAIALETERLDTIRADLSKT